MLQSCSYSKVLLKYPEEITPGFQCIQSSTEKVSKNWSLSSVNFATPRGFFVWRPICICVFKIIKSTALPTMSLWDLEGEYEIL